MTFTGKKIILGFLKVTQQQKKLLTSQIKSELDEYGIDYFVEHEDIEPTTQWLTEIKKALVNANISNILDKNIITNELLNKARKHRLEVLIDDFLNSSNFSISTELLRKIENLLTFQDK
ncbi:hypothetical protein [Spirobacillus cienkowskii]|uniref:hypothetical protein n=1 Tax=Spirobacillus cienkowskii TaxID=495820 RepID=UPI0030D478C1